MGVTSLCAIMCEASPIESDASRLGLLPVVQVRVISGWRWVVFLSLDTRADDRSRT